MITGDWHADARTIGRARFGDVDRAVRQMVEAAIEQSVDMFCFLGDLCDPDAGSVVFRCAELAISAALTLQRADVVSVWVAGNHDVIEDGSGDTTLTPLRPIAVASKGIVRVFEQPGTFVLREGGDVGLLGVMALPFTATSHAYRPSAFVDGYAKEMQSRSWVVLGHLAVAGVVPGEETTDMPRGREVVLPRECFPQQNMQNVHVFNGHYHAQQVHDAPGVRPVHIPGAPVRLTFADGDRVPSFLIVEV